MGKTIALDVETDGLDLYAGARIFCWSYMTDKGEYGFMRKSPQALRWIAKLFADPTRRIVFQNAKFDLKMFIAEGIDVFGMKAELHDTLFMSKLFNEGYQHDLHYLGIRYLNRDPGDKEAITKWLKENTRAFQREHGRKPNFSDAPIDIVRRRALWDTETTLLLFLYLFPRIKAQCPNLYKNEMELLLVVIDLEARGVRIDLAKARDLKAECVEGLKTITAKLNALLCPLSNVERNRKCKTCNNEAQDCDACGGTGKVTTYDTVEVFNPNSQAECVAAFQKMGIELRYKTVPKKKKDKKTGQHKMAGGGKWAFNEYAMMRYVSNPLMRCMRESSEDGWGFTKFYEEVKKIIRKGRNPGEWLPPLILKSRELSKMVSTYYNAMLDRCVAMNAEGTRGTLHCSFNQSEAITGRFSCSEPNLQNIPRILGPRECFVPRKGYANWHFDYEQVEMKFFVHFAKDPKMAKAIENDIHLEVASEIYGITREKVTKEQRKRAKAINFGVVYGAGGKTIAETLTIKGLPTTKSEGMKLVAAYHRKFPSVRALTEKLKSLLIRQGYVANEYERMYHIPEKWSYKAINAIVQGQSADIIKFAMVKVWKWLRSQAHLKTRLIMQIHDELVLEIPHGEEDTVVPFVRDLMEDLKRFFVPITVDCEVATDRWSEKHSPAEAGYRRVDVMLKKRKSK